MKYDLSYKNQRYNLLSNLLPTIKAVVAVVVPFLVSIVHDFKVVELHEHLHNPLDVTKAVLVRSVVLKLMQ